MRRLLLFILILLSIEANGQLYPVKMNTIRYLSDAADGTDITQSLRNLIATAVDGDVIVLPAGKFIITGQIDITNKEISIIGNGNDTITGTMLYRKPGAVLTDYKPMISFNKGTSVFTDKIFVSGIYFKSLPSKRYSGGIDVSNLDQGIGFDKNTNFFVADNIFQYFGCAGIYVYHKDLIEGFNGLIFNNKFLDFYCPEVANYGYGIMVGASYNENKEWISDPEFGSNKFLFIEDNYFRHTRHAITGASNSKYVFRNNTVVDNWVAPSIDMHGAGTFGNVYSSRASESYSNTLRNNLDAYGNPITKSTPSYRYPEAMGIRGGEALIYNNSIENCRILASFLLEYPNPGRYPSPYQIGYLSGLKYGLNDTEYIGDHGNGDIFIWNNNFIKKFPDWITYQIDTLGSEYLKFNRDIHTDIAKPGYKPYIYPHDYRNYYYSFIDTFLNKLSKLSTANVTQTSVQLSWDNVLCEDGYYIYRSTDNKNFTIIDSTAMNVITKFISGLNAGTQYWFYIKGYNDKHEGLKSPTITINVNPVNPVYTGSAIENSTPSVLEMVYSLSLALVVPAASAFNVLVNSVTRTVNRVTVSGTKVLLTLASPVVNGNVVTVAYDKPSTNPLQTASGGLAVSVVNQPVINNCINGAPATSITSPVNNSSFPVSANIAISANASDADGSITLVEFYNGSTRLGSKSVAPYTFNWNSVGAGTYSLTVIATDNQNAKTTSSAISITVNDGNPVANQPPSITISNPIKGNKYEFPATIEIHAVASDPDGTIRKVELFDGSERLVEFTSAPYSYTWKDVKAGTYTIKAVATDNLNATTTSSSIEFSVEDVSTYDANSEIINLYPNPNDGHFSIEIISPLQNEKCEVIITDLAGKQVFLGPLLKEEILKQFDLSYLKSGIYIMMIIDKVVLVTKKIIKK